MAQLVLDLENLSGGGTDITSFTVLKGRAAITPSTPYTFSSDYKYVVAITYGDQGNKDILIIDGNSGYLTSYATDGSLAGQGYYTDCALFKDVASGKQLTVPSGKSLTVTILGFN